MLDINLLRAEKGGNPELVRESQRRRCVKDTNMVDEVIAVDVEWRQAQFQVHRSRPVLWCLFCCILFGAFVQVDNLRGDFGKLNKEIAMKKKAKEDADDLIAQSKGFDEKIKNAEAACEALISRRDELLKKIGNLVHDTVPISDNEDLNAIVRVDGLDRVLPADKIKEFKTVKVRATSPHPHTELYRRPSSHPPM